MTILTAAPASRRVTEKARPSMRAGFSLLELAIVITIIAMVTAVSVNMGQSMIQSVDIVATNHKLNVIEQALEAYRLGNERLPCPADASTLSTSATYGTETANTGGECDDGTPAGIYTYKVPPGGNSTSIATNTYVAEGAVPFKALGLPESFMYDSWGRKFAYAVWAPAAAEGAFLTYGIRPSCGAIRVNDASGNPRSQSSVYAVVSFGPDGHGGYLKDGTRYNAKSVNADEDTNAHYSSGGVNQSYSATYVQKDWSEDTANSLDDYSDLTRFKERWQMTDQRDLFTPAGAPCIPGARFDDQTAGDNGGGAVAVGDVNGDGIPDLVIAATGQNVQKLYVIFGTKTGWPMSPIPLLDGNGNIMDGTQGAEFTLPLSWSEVQSIAIGDINGDGINDIIIGDPGCIGCGVRSGSVYVLWGRSSGWPTSAQSLSTWLAGSTVNGVRIDGENTNDYFGFSVATGDVNGDGKTDLIVGAPGSNPGHYANPNGSVYVIYGGSTASWSTTQTANAAFLNGSGTALNGFRLDGPSSGFNFGGIGFTVAAGDVNGDGKADIVYSGRLFTSTYVVFGHPTGTWTTPQTVNTTFLANGGTALYGAVFNNSYGSTPYTFSVATGDVYGHGTGLSDIVIGAAMDAGCVSPGVVYVISGTTTPSSTWGTTNTLTTGGAGFLNGTRGFTLVGEGTPQNCSPKTGSSVAVSDVNGDGVGDIIVTGPTEPSDSTAGSSTYVIFGGPGPKSGGTWGSTPYTLNSSFLANGGGSNVVNGIRLDTATENAAGVYNISTVASGDLNGDGKNDIVIGALNASPNGNAGAGSVFVYWGLSSSAWSTKTTSQDLDTLIP